MITLQELKNEIENVESEMKKANISSDDIYIKTDYMNAVYAIRLFFNNDEYYGTFIQIEIQ